MTNLGSDTLYYNLCAGIVYLDELETESPRSFNVGNRDLCIQRDPLAPGDTTSLLFGTGLMIDHIAAGGLVSEYRLRLPQTFLRKDSAGAPDPRDPYVAFGEPALSEPFRSFLPR